MGTRVVGLMPNLIKDVKNICSSTRENVINKCIGIWDGNLWEINVAYSKVRGLILRVSNVVSNGRTLSACAIRSGVA